MLQGLAARRQLLSSWKHANDKYHPFAVGVEADADKVNKLISELEGKDLQEVSTRI